MLSPHYVHFVAESIGIPFSKALMSMQVMDRWDNNVVLLAALSLKDDKEARAAVRERLQDRGNAVLRAWDDFFEAVMVYNDEGVKAATVDVNDIIRRIQNADFG